MRVNELEKWKLLRSKRKQRKNMVEIINEMHGLREEEEKSAAKSSDVGTQ